MFWMVYCEQRISLPYLCFLICAQPVLFGELGGAFDRRAVFGRRGATLRWL
jgi:hypothetical protein